MTKIDVLGEKYEITKEFPMAVCVWETQGSDLVTYDNVTINYSQKVYNVKILETGSILFTLSEDSNVQIVTMFPQMFGFPTDEQMSEINKLEGIITESQNRVNKIYDSIERTGHRDIQL